MSIFNKGIGGLLEAVCKVSPCHNPGEIEQDRWQSIGRNFRYLAENHGKDQGGYDRLYQVPQRTEDSLLIDSYEVPAYEQHNQVAVTP